MVSSVAIKAAVMSSEIRKQLLHIVKLSKQKIYIFIEKSMTDSLDAGCGIFPKNKENDRTTNATFVCQ